ncbi:MAG: hypothetical protein JWR02_2594 [Mucilaginibacter sp.]|nr:hypothetical protein [Mucilaginibacter sp.]
MILNLVERLDNLMHSNLEIIPWGSPVLSFGKISSSTIATLGLNPSNREFVDNLGNELTGTARRFHTLSSLGISKWSDIEPNHIDSILELCDNYFNRNPYDSWFKKMDYLISGTTMSYYFPSERACHLDLIPFATSCKWMDLTNEQKIKLLEISGDILGELLKNSSIKVLILNGKTVVDGIQKTSDVVYERSFMSEWMLPRKNNKGVAGYSYKGIITKVGGVILNKEILVLGFNHNIQSSYGVTTYVQTSIRNWISKIVIESL